MFRFELTASLMKRTASAMVTCAMLAGMAAPALAHDGVSHEKGDTQHTTAPAATRLGELTLEAPWSRATPGGAKVAAGYLTITNHGATPDRLVGGSFPRAARVEIHEMSMKDGVMSMRPLKDGLEIPPGKSITFAPGGYHLMFMGLESPLKQGESVTGTLDFQKAGKVNVTYEVRGIAAGRAGSSHSGH